MPILHWQLGGASDHDVSEALYLTDPEGSGIEIYRDFPREEWPVAADGSLRMGTYPLDLEPVKAAAVGESDVPGGTGGGLVHLEVPSVEVTRDIYVVIIGFEMQTTVPAAVSVAAGGHHHHIGANTWHHRSKPVSGRGLSWFEVVFPDTQALDAIRERTEDSRIRSVRWMTRLLSQGRIRSRSVSRSNRSRLRTQYDWPFIALSQQNLHHAYTWSKGL